MIKIGKLNQLKVLSHSEFGAYLDGDEAGEILLPTRYLPEQCDEGDTIEVFICFDSEDRLIATTETPLAMVGDFALLRVVAVEEVGAFLDWGLPKDLFLPFAEQTRDISEDQEVLVYVYLDKSDRISASMRIERNLDKTKGSYTKWQPVNLMIAGKTDLGFKAIIEGKHIGILYADEVFQPLRYGQKIQGYIKKVRDDGKIDLSLNKTGLGAAADIAPKILELLEKKGGFLNITDKTPPETIYELFGVSKKKYKIAIGGLYKKRLITVEDDGIRLVKKK